MRMKNMILALLFLVMTTTGYAKTTQLSIEHFSKGSEYSNVKISPKGTYERIWGS
jgi:hypothetical protein